MNFNVSSNIYVIILIIFGILSIMTMSAFAIYLLQDGYPMPRILLMLMGPGVGLSIRFGRYLFQRDFDGEQSISPLSNPGLIAAFCAFFGSVLIDFLFAVNDVSRTVGSSFFATLGQLDLDAITQAMSNRVTILYAVWYIVVVFVAVVTATGNKQNLPRRWGHH